MNIPENVKKLNKRIIAAMIEAINDPGDPCELAYSAWLAAHFVDSNSNVKENIVAATFRRLGLPAGSVPGDVRQITFSATLQSNSKPSLFWSSISMAGSSWLAQIM